MIHPGSIRGSTAVEPAQLILDLVLRQIRAAASDGQEHGFLKAVGRDLAARFPLGDAPSLAQMEDQINDVWHMLDFGAARLSVAEDAVMIRHSLPDDESRQTSPGWRAAIPPMAEGAYDVWFRAMGSGPRLKTTEVGRSGDHVEFRHGL